MLEAVAGVDPLAAAAFSAYKLVRARKFKDAVAAYDGLVHAAPSRSDLWVNRGVALQALYRLDDAVDSFATALRARQDDVGALINRGAVLGWQGRYALALEDYDAAIAIEPDNEAALLGRSVVLSALGRFDEALADTETVLLQQPGHGGAHYNKGLILLSVGDYSEGLREHEWRFGTTHVLGQQRFKQPLWQGEPTDKRILVHCEQGLGDNLQFSRYLRMMGGLDVTIEAPRQLVRLFQQFGLPVIERDIPLPAFDLHVPMMSLGAIFGTTLETIPTQPYLLAHGQDWELAHLSGKRVGLSWSSGVRQEQPIAVAMQRRKSISTARLGAALLDIEGVSFVSLQKDEPEDGTLGIYDPMPLVRDLADTASIIANLDLVITVDSAVAHLAGAMGKPVWVLNRYDICWRWLSGDKKSPWYPTARVYRQSEPMRWDDVLRKVREDLLAYVATP